VGEPWSDVEVEVSFVVSSDDVADAVTRVVTLLNSLEMAGTHVLGWAVKDAHFIPEA
jgi:hypothetical protein